jgi:ABC-2 type transport system ATP-binding protein
MTGEFAIEAEGLTRRFGRLVAVDRLDLRICTGEIYGFLGRNGAGKTTTIRMILGMLRPDAGRVKVLGFPVAPGTTAPWRAVGQLVEAAVAYPELTVRENLEIARRLVGEPRAGAVAEAIERLGLGLHADRRARTLSLGNRQRLALARALLHRPRLVVLDEPTNGLDPAGVVEVRELLRSLARDAGATIFVSSHLLDEVERLATHVGILHEGRLVAELGAERLRAGRRRWLVVQARDREAAFGVLEAAGFRPTRTPRGLELAEPRALERPDDVATALVRAGVAPTRLAVEHESLESHFLRLTGAPVGEAA